MTYVLFFGCIFVTFGPALSLFLLTIAQNNQLIIITIGGSFFWLLSILVASLWWYIIPLHTTYAFIIPFSVFFQEAGRYVFYRLYAWGFPTVADRTNPASSLVDATGRTTSVSGIGTHPPLPEHEDATSIASSSHGNPRGGSSASESDRRRAAMRESARLRSLAQMPNILAAATALGLGSGVTYALVMYTSVLWEATGPGTLFSPACPSTSMFMISALITSMFVALHVFLSIIAFEGFRTKSRFLIGTVWAVHLVGGYLTMANLEGGNCAGSVVPIAALVVFSGAVARHAALKSGFVKKKD